MQQACFHRFVLDKINHLPLGAQTGSVSHVPKFRHVATPPPSWPTSQPTSAVPVYQVSSLPTIRNPFGSVGAPQSENGNCM